MDVQEKDALAQKIQTAPLCPGCYVYRDKSGCILYVGKAKCLRTRVRQYFSPRALKDERMADFVGHIRDVEFHVTDSELDALLLEYRLIKQHKPPFNSQLKANKPRPFLRVDKNAQWPTLSVAGQPRNDGAVYLGCFTDEEDIHATLHVLNRVWHTPVCGKPSFEKPGRGCLYRYMGACLAPCTQRCSQEQYRFAIGQVLKLFRGKRVAEFSSLRAEMLEHAQAMEFEQAAAIKRLREDLHRLRHKSRRTYHLPPSGQALVFARPYREADFSVFYALDGAVLYRADFCGGLQEPQMDALVQQIVNGAPALQEPWLPGCLGEVFMDKLFVPLRARTQKGITAAMQNGYALFVRPRKA